MDEQPAPPERIIRSTRKRKPHRGKPPIPVNLTTIRSCLIAGFNLPEIAVHIGMKLDTLKKRIKRDRELAEMIETGPALRRGSLKLWQTKKAQEGSVPMLIHLGKVELGQTEQAQNQTAAGQWLVETRPKAATPEDWADQYGPMRQAGEAGKPPADGEG